MSQLHLGVLDGLGCHGAGAGPEICFPLLWVHVDVVRPGLHVLVVAGGAWPAAFPRENQGRVIELFFCARALQNQTETPSQPPASPGDGFALEPTQRRAAAQGARDVPRDLPGPWGCFPLNGECCVWQVTTITPASLPVCQ